MLKQYFPCSIQLTLRYNDDRVTCDTFQEWRTELSTGAAKQYPMLVLAETYIRSTLSSSAVPSFLVPFSFVVVTGKGG